MRRGLGLVLAALAVGIGSCSGPVVIPEPTTVEDGATSDDAQPADVLGSAGGASSEDNPKLTGLPGIDQGRDLDVKILDARGSGRMGGVAIPPGKPGPLAMGQWLLTDEGSEYEITLRSSLVPDGIVRLEGASAFLVEGDPEGAVPAFRVFGGQVSFYLPHLNLQTPLRILTPVGPLVTRGAVFTVTVAPDSQVLITCREGSVALAGTQNAVVMPGRVVVADRHGRGRVYPMTPNEAMVFSERWLKIMTEEAGPVLAAALPRRLAAWAAVKARYEPEQARFLALWFWEARSVLGPGVPGPDTWAGPLAAEVRPSVWTQPLPTPGLLGELP